MFVNFSSGWGRETIRKPRRIAPAKRLSKALAQELPGGMAATPLNPGIIDTDMQRPCFGVPAQGYANEEQRAKTAVPWLLGLGPKDNECSLSVGDAH